MNFRKTILKRTFSDFQPWQTAGLVVYRLLSPQPPDGAYGIQICELRAGCRPRTRHVRLFTPRRQALRMLRFLWENAVLPAQLEAIVQDLAAEGQSRKRFGEKGRHAL